MMEAADWSSADGKHVLFIIIISFQAYCPLIVTEGADELAATGSGGSTC